MICPSSALYRSFLQHCTLTNKAMGTIWRALCKPPQRRQGPDPYLLWLLIEIPSALRPMLPSRWADYSLFWRMSWCIFDTLTILIALNDSVMILWPLCCDWMLALGLYKEYYFQILKCMSFWLRIFCVNGKVCIPKNVLTKPVLWLSLLKLTALSRPAIVV